MKPQQDVIEQSVVLQDIYPSVDTNQKRRPERQYNGHDQKRLPGSWRARDAVGDRVADREKNRSRNRANLQALEIGEEVDQIGRQQSIRFERQVAEKRRQPGPTGGNVEYRRIRRLGERRLRQADLQDDDKRRKKKNDQPKIGRQYDRPCAPASILPKRMHRLS